MTLRRNAFERTSILEMSKYPTIKRPLERDLSPIVSTVVGTTNDCRLWHKDFVECDFYFMLMHFP
eukprot:scaffold19935_cov203-Skeletonema_marinoi.AAC.6